MFISYPFRTFSALIIALSCYTSTFPAAEPVQDSGDDGWYGLAPIDVNPDINVNYGAPIPVEADGKTLTQTAQSWADPNTQDLGVATVTKTENGNPITTAITQYAKIVEATTTSDGKAAVATNMVVTPKMLDVLRKTADKAISACNAKRKRQAQVCTLTDIANREGGREVLRLTLVGVAQEQKIEIGAKTVAALTTVFLLGAGADLYMGTNAKHDQYVQPVTVPIEDPPEATTTTSSSAQPAVTAWIDPPYDLDSWFHFDIEPNGPTPTAFEDVSTSIFCSSSAAPRPTIVVDAAPALEHGKEFCSHIGGSIFGLGEPYNGTQEQYEGKFGYYTKWADTKECKDPSINYIIDEEYCKEYMTEIIARCDPPAPDNPNGKLGGTVTDGCMVFELQPYEMATAPAPEPETPEPEETKPCPVSVSLTSLPLFDYNITMSRDSSLTLPSTSSPFLSPFSIATRTPLLPHNPPYVKCVLTVLSLRTTRRPWDRSHATPLALADSGIIVAMENPRGYRA